MRRAGRELKEPENDVLGFELHGYLSTGVV